MHGMMRMDGMHGWDEGMGWMGCIVCMGCMGWIG